MTALNLDQHEQVKFEDDHHYWWTVRAVDHRFAVLTRHTPFRSDGVPTYTIIDTQRDVRGPCNLIGQGWDFDSEDLDGSAEELLIGLNGGYDTLDDESLPDDERRFIAHVEVSYRNNVPIRIRERRHDPR